MSTVRVLYDEGGRFQEGGRGGELALSDTAGNSRPTDVSSLRYRIGKSRTHHHHYTCH